MSSKFNELTNSLVQSVTRRAALKKFTLVFAGLLLISSWTLQAARFALPNAHLPLTAPRAAAHAPTARQKVELGERLSTVVRDPAHAGRPEVSPLLDALRVTVPHVVPGKEPVRS